MNFVAAWRRTLAGLWMIALAALLSGCVLSSEAVLVNPEDAVALPPENFPFVTYKDAKDGNYTRSDDQPGGGFARVAGTNTWADPKGDMTIYFVPRPDGTYLLSIVRKTADEQGALYGIARYSDNILELRMIFSGDPAAELSAAGAVLPAGARIEQGGVVVTDRDGLETILELIASGSLSTAPLVAWVGSGAAPATLAKDGDWYKGS